MNKASASATTSWPAATGQPRYPKPVWVACFAAQLHELRPILPLAEAVQLAEASHQDLCSLEPEFAACEIAMFLFG